MKSTISTLLLVVALTGASSSPAQNVYTVNVVGYVNRAFGPGDTLFANPLKNSSNKLSEIFSGTPNNTTISLWNPTTRLFDVTSVFNSGLWSIDFTLNPGTGAKLTAPTLFTNTFVGEVVTRTGAPFSEPLPPAPLFNGPNGVYLLADKMPVANSGTNIFINILGRMPNAGEQVITLTTTSTYLGNGDWDITPTLGVSDSAFLNVGPVPEPSTAVLSGLALLALIHRRRQ